MDNSALLAQDGNATHTSTGHDIQADVEPSRRSSLSRSSLSQSPRPDSPPSAFERRYDPPEIRTHDTDSDIVLQQLDEPLQPGHAESPTQYKNNYGYLGAEGYNSTFDSDTRSLLSAKHYDHHESRKFILKTGAYRFMITLGFSIAIGLCLKTYEGFSKPLIMSRIQVRYFNAIMLGLSLGLGLNLASSLKRYAVILRWYLLTRRYVSLEVFDLILGLETLTKVGKLMIISLPGIRKVKFLNKLPWFREARDDDVPNFMWIGCALWILLNIAAQVLVAALSLFWPVDPSDAVPLMTYGNVTVANLQKWSSNVGGEGWANLTYMEAASSAGMEASVYPEFPLNEKSRTDLSSLPGTPLYHDNGTGVYEYRFYNRNPAHQFESYIVSERKIRATASCQELKLNGSTTDDFLFPDKSTGRNYLWAKVSHQCASFCSVG